MVKKDLEMLYKEYVMLITNFKFAKGSPESHGILTFEKNINKINEKT